MRRSRGLLGSLLLLAGCTSGFGVSAASSGSGVPATPTLSAIGAGLQGPAGLAASVYATGLPDVSAFAFDASGRLWAATAAYGDTGTDAIYLIGAAGSSPVKVVDGLHTVLGLVWAKDTLYVSSAGRVDAYTGLAGHAFARQTAVLTLPAGTGEANGLVMSSAGRLVLGVSAPCDACTPTSQYAAAVISFLPDGSDLRIEASGIRAPVGLTFAPRTDTLFVTMNQRDDLGDATPGDWLAVVRSGQAWGFPGCYGQGGSVCGGVPAPVAVLDPHAAVSGVAIVTGVLSGSGASGGSGGSSALVAEWATGKILRVALAADGTTASGPAEPFLLGLTKPVPVIGAPDGAVIVGDWGTGAIYRVAGA
jgi:glucose/arabinose dehydrogenase